MKGKTKKLIGWLAGTAGGIASGTVLAWRVISKNGCAVDAGFDNIMAAGAGYFFGALAGLALIGYGVYWILTAPERAEERRHGISSSSEPFDFKSFAKTIGILLTFVAACGLAIWGLGHLMWVIFC